MSHKKDMRREDLIIAYSAPEEKDSNDMLGTMSSTLPMAAIFTRNKFLGWTAVVFALQNWLSESPGQASRNGTPGYFTVGMALLSVVVAYLPLFMPPQQNQMAMGMGAGTRTEAADALPSRMWIRRSLGI